MHFSPYPTSPAGRLRALVLTLAFAVLAACSKAPENASTSAPASAASDGAAAPAATAPATAAPDGATTDASADAASAADASARPLPAPETPSAPPPEPTPLPPAATASMTGPPTKALPGISKLWPHATAAKPAATAPPPTAEVIRPTPSGTVTEVSAAGADHAAAAPVSAEAGKLASRPVSYNKPTTLTFGEATPVQLIIDVNGVVTSEAFENLPGEVKTHNVLVSPEMTAELTGPVDRVKIQLRPGYPPWQKVTKLGNPTWIWDVTALAPGTTHIDLAIKAKVDAGATEEVIRTYHDTIPVKMGVVDSIKWWIAQIDPIWKWIIGVVTVLGGAFVWWRTNVGRKKA